MMLLKLALLLWLTLAGSGTYSTPQTTEDASIIDVNQAKLYKVLETSNFTAVYWYARNCKRSERVLKDLETLDEEAAKQQVKLYKINDKRLGKSLGVKKFPALTFFRGDEVIVYDGSLQDKEGMLDFLTDEDNLAIPDKIEEVVAEEMLEIVEQSDLVAVFFYDESKASAKALNSMEDIDEETDVFGIRFLRINDGELASDYSLPSVPQLVFFRYEIPVVYEGDLKDEYEVLEWLIVQRNSADEQDMIEFVNQEQLDIMVRTMDNLLILFLDNSRLSNKVLEILETIDDDCDNVGISFVAVKDRSIAASYTIDDFPSLAYFEQEIPSLFDGDLENATEALEWVVNLLNGDHIEEVTNDILDKFIATKSYLAVLFYKEDEPASEEALEVLEQIDDDLDKYNIMFVKISDVKEADEYGIEQFPTLVVFENGIPNMFGGSLASSGESVLEWIIAESSGDHTIESVTDNMLDALVLENDHVAALFCEKDDKTSQDVLKSMEHIDDDAASFEFPIKFVSIQDNTEAKEYGLPDLPALVYFDKQIPNIYNGDLYDNEEILTWMTEQATGSHVEDVSSKILGKLLKHHEDVTVLFYTKGIQGEERLVKDLEEVDHILEEQGVPLVKIDDISEAERWGLDVIPGIVHFQYKDPHIYKGDLANEKKIVDWVLEMRSS